TGSKSDFRFRQITGAYAVLKGLTPEELEALAPETKQAIYDYAKSDSESESDSRTQSQTHNIEPDEYKSEKFDEIINKYELEIKNFYVNNPNNEQSELNAIIFRLKSQNPGVINTALKHSGHLANKPEFRRALCEVLKRPVIDEQTAKLAGSLPFEPQTRKQLALDSAENAGNFPAGLIINLIGDDFAVMEKFLLFVTPENAPLIIRRLPSGKTPSYGVLRHLLSSDDEKLLVPLLSAMKLKFPKAAHDHKNRLYDLELHSSPAVRAWAKQLRN
ncbi:MAG: hypothetical protein IJQ56_01390, partial [Synergistaceae bacterium]|nr:hypothetical protein [Synergistaceae bacterium]